jgi:hypothetical protein
MDCRENPRVFAMEPPAQPRVQKQPVKCDLPNCAVNCWLHRIPASGGPAQSQVRQDAASTSVEVSRRRQSSDVPLGRPVTAVRELLKPLEHSARASAAGAKKGRGKRETRGSGRHPAEKGRRTTGGSLPAIAQNWSSFVLCGKITTASASYCPIATDSCYCLKGYALRPRSERPPVMTAFLRNIFKPMNNRA